jgi:hypothetical protein
MLRKEKPNFVPRQIVEKIKKEQEAKEAEAIKAIVDKELQEEEISKQLVKKAEETKKVLVIPRPQFALDEDDDEFED